MINATQTARRRSEAPPVGSFQLYWNDRTKRWDVTVSTSTDGVMGKAHVDTTVALDRATCVLLLDELCGALERLLPL